MQSYHGFFGEKKNVRFNVSEKNLLSDLCQYAETPECTRQFIAS